MGLWKGQRRARWLTLIMEVWGHKARNVQKANCLLEALDGNQPCAILIWTQWDLHRHTLQDTILYRKVVLLSAINCAVMYYMGNRKSVHWSVASSEGSGYSTPRHGPLSIRSFSLYQRWGSSDSSPWVFVSHFVLFCSVLLFHHAMSGSIPRSSMNECL